MHRITQFSTDGKAMIGREQTQRKLKSELDRLKQTFGLGQDLKVTWLPGHMRRVNEREILGEVLGGEIRTAEYSPRATGAK